MVTLKLLLSTPLMWVFYCLAVALILLRKIARTDKRLRLGWRLLLGGAFILFLTSFAPLADGLHIFLQSQYAPPSQEVLKTLEVVTILGGGVEGRGDEAVANGHTYRRLVGGIEFFRRSRAKVLVLQGAEEEPGGATNAAVMRRLALARGIADAQIVTEEYSHTTAEHPQGLLRVFPKAESAIIGVVTSAIHMPRAVRTFVVQLPNATIVPLPVEYANFPRPFRVQYIVPSANALGATTAALHEWLGMVWYWIRY